LRLRAGGNYILESIESSLVVSRKSNINFVQEKRLDFTQEEHYIRSNRTIALQANGKIYLLAGMDYTVFRDPKTESNINSEINQTIKTNAQTKVPGIAPVVVFQNGCLRVSDRVYASCSQFAPGIGLGSLVLPSSLGVGGKTYVQDTRADGSVVNREVSGENFSVKLPAGCNNISPKFYDSARTNINATA
jgi:hypothetical protein